ncbi:MAG: hypothetical protein PHU42_02290 [Patescibacteria group bacterium]|nr:hypothetical protein [Patescibacteria group bacterium]
MEAIRSIFFFLFHPWWHAPACYLAIGMVYTAISLLGLLENERKKEFRIMRRNTKTSLLKIFFSRTVGWLVAAIIMAMVFVQYQAIPFFCDTGDDWETATTSPS